MSECDYNEPWYHGSPERLDVLRKGSWVTQFKEVAKAFSHRPSRMSMDGGWPAEERFYTASKDYTSGSDRASWGKVSKTRMNEWVTADALGVLRVAGR